MAIFQFFISGTAVFLAIWLVCASGISTLMNKLSDGLAGVDATGVNFVYDGKGVSTALYNLTPLMHKQRQVILIGASNVRWGFRARKLKKALAGISVHNLAISGGSAKNYEEIVRLSFNAVPKEAWRSTTYVLGVVSGTFVKPYKNTNVQVYNATADFWNAATRYGLYRFTNGSFGIQPTVPHFLFKTALIVLRPAFVFDRFWKNATDMVQHCVDIYIRTPISTSEVQKLLKRNKITKNEKLESIQESIDLGNISQERFRELYNLADLIHRHGANLVLVDLPLPKWYSSSIPAFADYQKRKMKWFHLLQRKYNVAYINMQDGFPDSIFVDHVHPRPAEAPVWSKILAKKLRLILASQKTSLVAATD